MHLLRQARGVAPPLQPYVELLANWDCVVSKDSAPAALFEIWWPKLGPAIFKPHVLEKAWPLVSGRLSAVRIFEVLEKPRSRWFGADPQVRRDALLSETLDAAVAEAKAKLGSDPAKWR